MLHYLKIAKVFISKNISDIDDIENFDKEKE